MGVFSPKKRAGKHQHQRSETPQGKKPTEKGLFRPKNEPPYPSVSARMENPKRVLFTPKTRAENAQLQPNRKTLKVILFTPKTRAAKSPISPQRIPTVSPKWRLFTPKRLQPPPPPHPTPPLSPNPLFFTPKRLNPTFLYPFLLRKRAILVSFFVLVFFSWLRHSCEALPKGAKNGVKSIRFGFFSVAEA